MIRKIIPNDSGCSDSWVKKKKKEKKIAYLQKKKKREMKTVDLHTAYMISLFAHANLSVIARRGNIHTRVYIYIYIYIYKCVARYMLDQNLRNLKYLNISAQD